MRIFRARYNRDGEARQSSKWYVEIRDGNVRRRIPAFTDKKASEEFGRKVERLAACRAAKLSPDAELGRWIEELDKRTRERLMRVGLLDSKRAASSKPLMEHVKDFEQAMLAKGGTADHVQVTVSRVEAIINACKFTYWSEIAPGKVQTFLAGLRTPKSGNEPGLSIATTNYYIGAFKHFCRWMIRDGRASESPMAQVQKLNANADRRLVRRALPVDECRRLLTAASSGSEVGGMSGPERATLYRLALETGLRWNELRSLTRASFDLKAEQPTVTVRAAYSKHRRDDTLPLRRETASVLKAHLAGLLPEARAFRMPDRNDGAKILREDLAVANIPETDAAGDVVDFHSLRHTFITNLCNSGVHPKVAQALARHSSITLTMDRYTHLSVLNHTKAIESLPDLDAPVADEAKATGTQGAAATKGPEKSLPKNLPQSGSKTAISGHQLQLSGRLAATGTDDKNPAPALENPRASGMIDRTCEGGGIGIRAGLRIQSRKG